MSSSDDVCHKFSATRNNAAKTICWNPGENPVCRSGSQDRYGKNPTVAMRVPVVGRRDTTAYSGYNYRSIAPAIRIVVLCVVGIPSRAFSNRTLSFKSTCDSTTHDVRPIGRRSHATGGRGHRPDFPPTKHQINQNTTCISPLLFSLRVHHLHHCWSLHPCSLPSLQFPESSLSVSLQ